MNLNTSNDAGKKDKLSIIIPAYNEEDIIVKTLEAVEKTFSGIIDYEIVVVDDGSKDRTWGEAYSYAKNNPKVKLISKKGNGGKGNALKLGFLNSTGSLILFMDADLELHPNQFFLFYDLMKLLNADGIVGSKRHPLSRVEYPFKRKVLSSMYNWMTRAMFGLKIMDTQVGLKLFKRDVLKDIVPRLLVKRYAFDVELLAVAVNRKFRIAEAPVDLNYKRFSSRINLFSTWKFFVDTAAIFYRIKVLNYYDRVVLDESAAS
ncbi:MAG: glycosyltransferase family 2 protein [Candidatus Aenigmarchaeota archaeon]|nr:glycosyltransferase family 2 protein [Candidatus Aenigmarchaeota archaeon]PIW41452.1 MAG: hypothetical protein COW21_01830 [Candidatus Aenigmarchaeota archaeon CG15_BIG_FIL_POST_REV_8_21_14_020_37_27]